MPGINGVMKVSSRDVFTVIFRYKLMIVSIFVGVTALVAVVTCMRPAIYRAEANLLIRLGRENLAIDPSVSGPTVNPYMNRENEVNSELAIMASRDLAERLVDSLGASVVLGKREESGEGAGAVSRALQEGAGTVKNAVRDTLASLNIIRPLSEREKAIKRVMRDYSAEVGKRTNIINAHYEASDPELAKTALDRLVNFYLERHIEVYSAQATPEFFESQADALHAELLQRQGALEQFRAQHGIADLDRQKEILAEQIASLKSQVDEAAAKVSGYEARVAALQKTLDGRDGTHEIMRTTGKTNYAADAIKERLAELRLQETDMAARYPDTHRPLAQLREQIGQMEASLAGESPTLTEVTTGLDENRERLQYALDDERTHMRAEQARRDALEAQLGLRQGELVGLIDKEVELAGLARDAELVEKEYRDYRDNLSRAKISTAMDRDRVSNVGVVQPATVLPVPVRPNKPLDIFLGMLVALFLGVFLAFVRDQFDDSVRSREQVEQSLGVPVLAVVPEKTFKKCI